MIDNVIEEIKEAVNIYGEVKEKKERSDERGEQKIIDEYSLELKRLSVKQKEKLLYDIESIFYNDKDVESEYCSLQIIEEENIYGNFIGTLLEEKNNMGAICCNLVLSRGNQVEKSINAIGFKKLVDIDSSKFGNGCVKVTKSMLNRQDIEKGEYNVILKNNVVSELLGHFIAIFDMGKIKILKEKIGEQIFSTLLTLVDEPHKGFNIRNFDCMGMPTKKIILIQNGVLQTLLCDRETAERWKIEPVGSAEYDSSGKIKVGINNLYILPGTTTIEEMLEQVQNGILVTEIDSFCSGTDVNNGNFNCVCKGKIIIDGKEGSALNLFLLRGNFLTILKKLEVIGNDSYLNLKEGFYECPSIAVGKLQVDNI